MPYANLSNPQTLNLYAMVSDNPETFADLDGHCNTASTGSVGSGDHNTCPGPAATKDAKQGEGNTGDGLNSTEEDVLKFGEGFALGGPIGGLLNVLIDPAPVGDTSQPMTTSGAVTDAASTMAAGVVPIPGAKSALNALGKEEANVAVYTIEKEGKTVYAGITNDLERRAGEHGADLTKVVGGLTRSKEAKGVEQALIETHGLAKNGGTLLNKINSISPKNSIYKEAVQFGRQLLEELHFP